MHRTDEALKELNAIIAECGNTRSYARRAAILARLGRTAEALTNYAVCVPLMRDAKVEREYAALLLAAGQSEAADAMMKQAEEREKSGVKRRCE